MDPESHQVYVDNAATSFPKPPEVLQEMCETYARLGVSPGRGSHDLAGQCERYVAEVRGRLKGFFNGDDAERVIFAYNATDALNMLILGMVQSGCHVVSSRLEHNSVLRPLYHLRKRGLIRYDLVAFDGQGFVDPRDVAAAIRPETRFVILNHVSNVLGTIQPVEQIGRVCSDHRVPLLLDASQSAGVVPIDMQSMHVDAVAFTGHKSLLGPTGIGGLVLRSGLDVRACKFGGTGFESWSLQHPEEYPQRLEAGTINVLGVMGLAAGVRYIEREGLDRVYEREMTLAKRLKDGLASVKRVRLLCADTMENHVALLSCTIDGMDPEDVAAILDGDFGIATRSGLHCAPLVHEDLGTSSRGAVRFSLGPLNTKEDIMAILRAVETIVS